MEQQEETRRDGESMLLEVPENFCELFPGIYRCSYPEERHFEFIKTLKLKTILTLIDKDYREENLDFNEANDILLIQIGLRGNKEPFVDTSVPDVQRAIAEMLDIRNHPILLHCQKGKHRTGCVSGALRKMAGWSYSSIIEEYNRYAGPKQRYFDKLFLETFDVTQVPLRNGFTPSWLQLE